MQGARNHLVRARKESLNACPLQNVVEHCAVQRLGICRKIRRRRDQMKVGIESVDGKNVIVNQGRNVVWRTWAVVFGAQKEIVEDLLPEWASGNARVLGKFRRSGRDIVHTPVSERRRNVEQGYDETSRTTRSVRP